MLSKIKAFFEEHMLVAEPSEEDKTHALHLATTALLIEMMRMDDKYHDSEQKVLLAQVKSRFTLSDEETSALVDLATTELKNATDYYQFTSLINQHFEYEQKIGIIEALWEVAYADNELDMDEEYLVRKISELIYVSHPDFISAKLKVRK